LYDDPFELGGEVRFLQAPMDSSTVDLINFGIRSAVGTIVHVVTCDIEVIDGWTESALIHFDDPTVGSVSPRVLGADGSTVVSRGVGYAAGGRRTLRVKSPSRLKSTGRHVAGPALSAGFYCRQAVLDVGGFCREVGDELADVDLALAFQSVGLRAIHEANSTVLTTTSVLESAPSFRRGLQAERLFWRNGALCGWSRSLLSHPCTLAGELLGNLHRPTILLQLLGRAVATCEFASYRRRRRRLEAVRAAAQRLGPRVLPFKRPQGNGCSDLLRPRTAA
jgi:hypothetical protein